MCLVEFLYQIQAEGYEFGVANLNNVHVVGKIVCRVYNLVSLAMVKNEL